MAPNKIASLSKFLDEYGDQPTLLDTLEDLGLPTEENFHLWRQAYREFLAVDKPGVMFPIDKDKYPTHYPSPCEDNPLLICFYETEDKFKRDVRTKIKPGRYLTTYYNHFSSELIKTYVDDYMYEHATPELHFTGPDDMDLCEKIYETGPTSCMSRVKGYLKEDYEHPAKVYASPDVSIAYVLKGSRITARAVVNQKKKTYSKLYGHTGILEQLLNNAGYKRGSLAGCRLRKIPARTNDKTHFMMPYLDGAATHIEHDPADPEHYFVVTADKGVHAQLTSAIVTVTPHDHFCCSFCSTTKHNDSRAEQTVYYDGEERIVCTTCFTDHFVDAMDVHRNHTRIPRAIAIKIENTYYTSRAAANADGWFRNTDNLWARGISAEPISINRQTA